MCGATAGHDPKEDLRYVWTFELKIIGSNSFYDEDLKGLMELIADGKMKPVIDKVLPLEQAVEGLRLIEDREVIGKVDRDAVTGVAKAGPVERSERGSCVMATTSRWRGAGTGHARALPQMAGPQGRRPP